MKTNDREENRTLLSILRERGIRLCVDGDRIVIRGKGVRDERIVRQVRENKPELLRMLTPQPENIIQIAAEMFDATIVTDEGSFQALPKLPQAPRYSNGRSHDSSRKP